MLTWLERVKSVCYRLIGNSFSRQAEQLLNEREYFKLGKVEHTFSHKHWIIEVVHVKTSSEMSEMDKRNGGWVPLTQLMSYTFPNVFHKVLHTYTTSK